MPNSSSDDQDQRKTNSMEDSTAMTIEFLRARLLSERSVSRTARQRADELATRVAELEEQLEVVSLQRKLAEKATADVLSILRNHGVSDVSDAFDSSCDQETPVPNCRANNNSMEEEETSANNKVRRNGLEDISGSDLESSPLTGRRLSWKSGKDSPLSMEKKKHMDSSRRRRNNFGQIGSFSSKRVGKSCRQIRRKETRSVFGEVQSNTCLLPLQWNANNASSGASPSCSENGPTSSKEGSEKHEVEEGLNTSKYSEDHVTEKDMERALEQQAQLIGRYEAEEKAQREWEEKYRENNNCPLDSCDLGNHSDVTEEREESKPPVPLGVAGTVVAQDQVPRVETAHVCASEESKTPGFGVPPHFETEHLQDKKQSSTLVYESSTSEFSFPMANGKHNQELIDNHHSPSSMHSNSFSGNDSADASASHAVCKPHRGDDAGRGDGLALIPQESCYKLGSVLGQLQQAKLSLKQKIDRLPLVERKSDGKAVVPSVLAPRNADRFGTPVGFAGLFRVPTDYQLEAATQASYLGLNSRLSLTDYSPKTELVPASDGFFAGDPFITGPSSRYMELRPSASAFDPYVTSPSSRYMDPAARVSPNDLPITRPFAHYTELRSSASASDPIFATPTGRPMEPRSGAAANDPIITSPSSRYIEPSSGFSKGTVELEPRLDATPASSSRHAFVDPHLGTGLPSFSKYSFQTYPAYPDQIQRVMPFNEVFSRTLPSREVGMPSASRPFHQFYGDHSTQDMYR